MGVRGVCWDGMRWSFFNVCIAGNVIWGRFAIGVGSKYKVVMLWVVYDF